MKLPLACWGQRHGASAVELAVVLPLLAVTLMAAVDFARLYYAWCVVTGCARNGAAYLSDPVARAESPYASLQDAATADATDLSPVPTVTSATGTDSAGNPYVSVTASTSYALLVGYPGLPNPVSLSTTVQMRVAPAVPTGPAEPPILDD